MALSGPEKERKGLKKQRFLLDMIWGCLYFGEHGAAPVFEMLIFCNTYITFDAVYNMRSELCNLE